VAKFSIRLSCVRSVRSAAACIGAAAERQERTRSGIPVLELNWLGDAFSHTRTAMQRTELIIFIRPQIIRDRLDARRVAEELRSKLRGAVETSNRPLIQLPDKRPAPIIQQ